MAAYPYFTLPLSDQNAQLSDLVRYINTLQDRIVVLEAGGGGGGSGSVLPVGTSLADFYSYFTPSATPDVGVSTPYTIVSGAVVKGVCNTADDRIALQQYMDACASQGSTLYGGRCRLTPRSDGKAFNVSGPLYYKHDTHYDGGWAMIAPTAAFLGTNAASPTTDYTVYSALVAYLAGDKVTTVGGRNYFCILANTGQPVTNTTYWKISHQGYIFEPDNRDASYLRIEYATGDGEVEYRSDRYKGTHFTLCNIHLNGGRDNLPGGTGSQSDFALNTSVQIGGILVNQGTDYDSNKAKSLLSTGDGYLVVRGCMIANMSGEGFRARGRGEGQYYDLQIIASTVYGFVHNEYDSNAGNISIGDSGLRGFVQLREFSRDNRYWAIKSWYSGRLMSKGWLITNAAMESWRINIGEPTIPDDPTTLIYSYSDANSKQVSSLQQYERYQRELAYIAGITNIATQTAAWTSGGTDGGSPYTGTGGTNDGVVANAAAVFGFASNPANNSIIKINGNTITFKNAVTAPTTQCLIGANAAATAANLNTMLALAGSLLLYWVTAGVVGTDVTVTSRMGGAAGNSIAVAGQGAVVTCTDVPAGTAVTKLRGGRHQPTFTPTVNADVTFSAGVYTATAHALAPNGLAWTSEFEGNNYYIEGADCMYMGCMGQDAYRADMILIGKRNAFHGYSGEQGPVQPRRIYWSCDTVVVRKSSFTDSGSYNGFYGCMIYDPSDPATNYALGTDGSFKNLSFEAQVPTTLIGGLYHKLAGVLSTGNNYARFNNGAAGAFVQMT